MSKRNWIKVFTLKQSPKKSPILHAAVENSSCLKIEKLLSENDNN